MFQAQIFFDNVNNKSCELNRQSRVRHAKIMLYKVVINLIRCGHVKFQIYQKCTNFNHSAMKSVGESKLLDRPEKTCLYKAFLSPYQVPINVSIYRLNSN